MCDGSIFLSASRFANSIFYSLGITYIILCINTRIIQATHWKRITGSCALKYKDVWKMSIWLSQWATNLNKGGALPVISWTDDRLSGAGIMMMSKVIASVIVSRLSRMCPGDLALPAGRFTIIRWKQRPATTLICWLEQEIKDEGFTLWYP